MRTVSASIRPSAPVPISFAGRAVLLARIWLLAGRVAVALRRASLAEVVASLGASHGQGAPLPAAFLSRAVSRGLRVGPWQPRCLVRSLVLYRMLRAAGMEPELVIGLPHAAHSADAHAWIEIAGQDVGPAPGRGPHRELTRYPR